MQRSSRQETQGQISSRASGRACVRALWRGARLGLVVVVAAPAASALARTVHVGKADVTVPSNRQIVVDGQTIDVQPGVTRVLVAAPPAGSTPFQVDGHTQYWLPAGATGEAFTYSSPSSYGDSVTVPTTAVYSSASAARKATGSVRARTASTTGPTCWITTYRPGANGGHGTVGNTTLMQCSEPNANQVQVRARAQLWWRSASVSTPWENQGYALSPWGYWSEDVQFPHACTRGTTNYWYNQGNGSSIYNGLQVSYAANSPQTLITCS